MAQIGSHRKPRHLGSIPFLAHPVAGRQQRRKLVLQHEGRAGRQESEYAQQLLSGRKYPDRHRDRIMFVCFQSVRTGRYPFQGFTEHLVPQAGSLQLVLLAGQRADAIRAFIKADGFVIHVEFLWMKKVMGAGGAREICSNDRIGVMAHLSERTGVMRSGLCFDVEALERRRLPDSGPAQAVGRGTASDALPEKGKQ